MEVELSIILPAIRKNNWVHFYECITRSTRRNFEVVIAGPHARLPPEMEGLSNVKLVRDFGSPIRASSIAAALCEGKYLHYASDDCTYYPGTLDACIDKLESLPDSNEKDVVSAKYVEGGHNFPDYGLQLNRSYPRTPFIPDNWYIFNTVIMYRKFFEELGGWDCEYETCAVAHADFAARAQRAGARVVPLFKEIFSSVHSPDITGDHAPIHWGHLLHDEPLYVKTYSDASCINRTVIEKGSWKKSPRVWGRRFA